VADRDQNDPNPARTAHDSCTSRLAQCAMNCGSTRPSDPTLPFFWGKPDEAYDTFYDGCLPGIGWD
jgi:hypothetical protein